MKKLLYLILVFFFFNSNVALAHPGGHYHKWDGNVLNTWRLNSGKTIQGNFSFAKDNTIYLEQEEGKIVSILLSDLSIQDQQLAKWKINKINHFNISDNVNTFPEKLT